MKRVQQTVGIDNFSSSERLILPTLNAHGLNPNNSLARIISSTPITLLPS